MRAHLAVKLSVAALSAAMLTGTGTPAHATTVEGGTDAGETIATATVISGAETTILGTLSASDHADIYAITIPDAARFTATTYNSQIDDLSLSLFDAAGHLIEYNNRWGGIWSNNNWGTLPPGTSGNPFAPSASGVYYLAVSGLTPADMDAASLYGGTPWQNPEHPDTTAVYGPQSATDVLSGWSGGTGPTGSYAISLAGVGTPEVLPQLYAVGYAGAPFEGSSAPSSLYTLDPADGQAALVGPIELNGTELAGITGIAFGFDGLLYAVDNNNRRLVTLATEAVDGVVQATVVGPFGDYSDGTARVSDLAFDEYGFLYGVSPTIEALVRVDQDGGLFPVAEYLDFDDAGDGIATAPGGQMYLKDERDLFPINHQTGELGVETELSTRTNSATDFSPERTLYTVTRPQTQSYPGTGSTLETVNTTTGFVATVGNDPDLMISAIAFDTGGGTPPGASTDLRIVKTVDNDYPSLGDDVVYTISVHNALTSDATDVAVTDVIPEGVTYKSADSAAYDGDTGVWTIGTLAGGATATLHLTVTAAIPGAQVLNLATLSTALYNPGPTVGRVKLTVAPVPPGAPTISAVAGDGRVLVTWDPPTQSGGAPVNSYNLYRCSSATAGCTVDNSTTPVTITDPQGSYLVSLLTNGQTYGFALAAINNAGEGPLSSTAYASPKAPTIGIVRAWPSKGKVYVSFTTDVATLETQTGYGPVTLQVTGAKGAWTSCTMDGGYCTVKSSAKTVTMRISDNGGTTWVESAVATVSRK